MMPASGTLTITVCREGIQDECHSFEHLRDVTVGKDVGCDLVLSDRGVSRTHCRFAWLRSVWTVCDLGSTNGLTINGNKVAADGQGLPSQPVALRSGDEIGVGMVVLRIQVHLASEDQTEFLPPMVVAQLVGQATGKASPQEPTKGRPSVPNPMQHVHTLLVESPATPKSMQSAKASNQSAKQPVPGKARPRETNQTTEDHCSPFPAPRKLPFDFLDYSIRKRIGIGGMGEVFLALDKQVPNRTLAIKFLRTHTSQSASERLRFIREMDIALTLKHVYLVDCFECGEDAGQLYLAMAYCNGGNLSDFLARTGKLSVRRAIRLLYRLLAGVDAAHVQGIVHRDLKPSNILLHREADGLYVPKISDFGLAKSFLCAGESGMTLDGTIGGSWAYMPKEQVINFRYVLPQSDVWSLGAILYECLTNQLPRPVEEGKDPIRTILESKLVPIKQVRTDLPLPFTAFLDTSLEVEADKRFRDAGQMRAALQEVAVAIGVEV